MLADEVEAAAFGNGQQEPLDAEVAVGHPEVALADLGHDLIKQGALLGVAVLAQDDVGGHLPGRLVDDQGLTRQRRRAVLACLLQAVLRGRQMVAVEDAHPIARDGLGQAPAEVGHDRLQAAGGVADQFGTDGGFDPLQLVVDAGQRDGDVNGLVHVGGADGGVSAGDHQTHQIDRGGEEQLPGVLLVRLPLEQLVQGGRAEGVFQDRLGHHGERAALHETLENRAQQHGFASWVAFLSSCWT